ncbi:toprim domain-containing protein [Helicobacter suis]|uniref:toprim domain-containing protein n=1 Tax=Helicobacter suis TaxID=104628 RepID=UPI0013D3D28E|nr:toprim domain-containing protein [Helicobacter suis]
MAYTKDVIYLPLDSILLDYGYILDKEKSSLNYPVLKHPNEKGRLIIKNSAGSYHYFNTEDRSDKGNIINFCQKRGLRLEDLIKGDAHYRPKNPITSQTNQQEQKSLKKDFQSLPLYDLEKSQLLRDRGIQGTLFKSYQHSLRADKYSNLCVPNYLCENQKLILSAISKRLNQPLNTHTDGSPRDKPLKELCEGSKGVQMLVPSGGLRAVKAIVITESILDSMAYLQMKGLNPDTTLLLGSAGQFALEKIEAFFKQLFKDIKQDKSQTYQQYIQDLQAYKEWKRYEKEQAKKPKDIQLSSKTFKIAFSRPKYTDKYNPKDMPVQGWQEQSVNTLAELAQAIKSSPYSSAVFEKGYRNASNAKSFTNLLIYDIDNDKDSPQLPLKQAQDLLEKQGIESLVMPSKSHQVEKNGHIADRYRILIPTAQPLGCLDAKSFVELNRLVAKTLGLYAYIDKKVLVDKGRAYYKSPENAKPVLVQGRILDIKNFKQQVLQNLFTEKIPQVLSPPSVVNPPDLSINIILACDNDAQGQRYTQVLEEILFNLTNQLPEIYTPFSKDCNDDLRLSQIIGETNTNANSVYGYVSRGLEQLESPYVYTQSKREILEKLENIATIKDFNTSTTNRLEKARTQVESNFKNKKRPSGK